MKIVRRKLVYSDFNKGEIGNLPFSQNKNPFVKLEQPNDQNSPRKALNQYN